MGKKGKIPSYHESSFTDEQSVGLITTILASHKRVMPHLESQDKRPNIDGYVEIQSSDNEIIGKIEVQIKTLPKIHNYKFKCDISFLYYCKDIALLPVILLLVDNQHKRIYWIYINGEFLASLNVKEGQKTKTITFNDGVYIDEGNQSYITNWENVVNENRRKFKEYDKYKNAYETLQKHANKTVGEFNDNFSQIHKFVDEINRCLDNEFKIVKDVFFPKQWKVGFAYTEYDIDHVSFVLYPIPYNKNDVLIKEIDEELKWSLVKEGLTFTRIPRMNPIEAEYQKYTIQIMKRKLDRIVRNKLLDHRVSIFMATEFVFGLIEKYHIQLGLEKRDTYALEEIIYAIYRYLPIWIEAATEFLMNRNPEYFTSIEKFQSRISDSQYFFDPEYLSTWIMPNEYSIISEKVESRLRNKKVKIPTIPIGSRSGDIPIGVLNEMLEVLQKTEVDNITRVYRPLNYALIPEGGNRYNALLTADLEYNLNIFFENIVQVYNNFLLTNFPKLVTELSFFDGNDKIFVTFNLSNEYKLIEAPYIEIFYLNSMIMSDSPSLHVIDKEEADLIRRAFESLDGEVTIRGQKYRVNSVSWSRTDFVYGHCPTLCSIYRILEDKLTKYFKQHPRNI